MNAPHASGPAGLGTRRLGRTDIRLTRIGIGGGPVGWLAADRADEIAQRALEAAWAAGIRYFDTAPFTAMTTASGALDDSRPLGAMQASSCPRRSGVWSGPQVRPCISQGCDLRLQPRRSVAVDRGKLGAPRPRHSEYRTHSRHRRMDPWFRSAAPIRGGHRRRLPDPRTGFLPLCISARAAGPSPARAPAHSN